MFNNFDPKEQPEGQEQAGEAGNAETQNEAGQEAAEGQEG